MTGAVAAGRKLAATQCQPLPAQIQLAAVELDALRRRLLTDLQPQPVVSQRTQAHHQ